MQGTVSGGGVTQGPGAGMPQPVEIRDPNILGIIPEEVKGYLQMRKEDFTTGYFVGKLLEVQRGINTTLDGQNTEGKLLQTRFGMLARGLMPGPSGMKVVPISPEEETLYKDRAGSREAAACMGTDFSLEMWHLPGSGGDAFSGPHGRIPPTARLDTEHLPIMARTFGYNGVALHTWLDVHPDDIRALSLNLLMRGSKINSAFHGAFHGPIFARGAMSSEYGEVRHLAKLLKQEGQLISMLGWDPATAIEEGLKESIGQEKVNEIRGNNAVVNALNEVSAGKKQLDAALTDALEGAGVADAGAVVGKLLTRVVDRSACAEVCDWDGTDGKMMLEAYSKPAGLVGAQVKPSLEEYLRGEVAMDDGKPVTRMDLLVQEKIERILMTGGLGVIKIEPKYHDPSAMTESDIRAVIEVRDRVRQGIRDYFGAQILSENPQITQKDYAKELEMRYKPYDGCITCQIEEGHSRQMPGGMASADVETAIHSGTMAGAYHDNWSPEATFIGDPDLPVRVTPDMVRRMYVLIKAGLVGPDADPGKRVVTEFDMAPRFWDGVLGFQASKNAVNVAIGMGQNLVKVERAMQARGELTPEEARIQSVCGTLAENQGIFQSGDTAQIFQVETFAYSMPIEGLKLVPASEDSEKFRAMIGKPYNIARPTAEIAAMMEAAG